VAGGAVQTPALLQRSGVRPPSGLLGRDLSVHPGAQVAAEFDVPVDGWKGAHQTHQVREVDGVILAAVNLPPSLVARSLPFAGDELGRVMDRYNHIVTAGALVEDVGRGRVRAVGGSGRALVTYPLHPRDGERVLASLARLSDLMFAAGASVVHAGVDSVPALRSPRDVERMLAFPGAVDRLVLSTVHLMGTAAMGADASRSVCGPDGAVHDAADLYVADASLFPGPVGVNPMLTIMALATRVARSVAERYA
jgi:choline dehydrogenase-like flavoprotein